MSQPTNSQKVLASMRAHPFYRGCALLILPEFIGLLLGFSFFMILHALLLIVFWILPYFPRAMAYVAKLLNLPAENRLSAQSQLTIWSLPVLAVKTAVIITIIWLGLDTLFKHGFLEQNLIWLMLND